MQLVASAVALAPALAGCPASSEEVRPPADDFYHPTGLAVTPDRDSLAVISANSDLRYDSGTLSLVDLSEVQALFDVWVGSGRVPEGRECEVDESVGFTLRCSASEVIRQDSTVRIGNFGTDLQFQELASGDARAFVGVRGDPSVTWIDFDPSSAELSCGGDGPYPQCDDEHRLRRIRGDSDLGRITGEPFGVFVDSGNEYALITHLTSGTVSLVNAPASGEPPVLADALSGLFAANSRGVRGAVGVAGRRPGSPLDRVYVTSRSEATVRTLYVVRGEGFPELATGRSFGLQDLVRPSNDARGITFNEDGTRAYVVNRSPPALHIVDTTIDPEGQPRNEVVGGVELCAQASNLTVADAGRGDRVYVSCFREGDVWVIDPVDGAVDAIIEVGRGPHGLTASEQHQQLYITTFLDHSLAVVDLEPGSVTENRVALRLGRGQAGGSE